MPADIVYDPAGTLTTVFVGADAMALLIVEAVTDPLNKVLQAAVVQFAHEVLGMPPGMPTADQSVARLEAMIPDQVWAGESIGRQTRIETIRERTDCLSLILLRRRSQRNQD
jgi:hypothetical protein